MLWAGIGGTKAFEESAASVFMVEETKSCCPSILFKYKTQDTIFYTNVVRKI